MNDYLKSLFLLSLFSSLFLAPLGSLQARGGSGDERREGGMHNDSDMKGGDHRAGEWKHHENHEGYGDYHGDYHGEDSDGGVHGAVTIPSYGGTVIEAPPIDYPNNGQNNGNYQQ